MSEWLTDAPAATLTMPFSNTMFWKLRSPPFALMTLVDALVQRMPLAIDASKVPFLLIAPSLIHEPTPVIAIVELVALMLTVLPASLSSVPVISRSVSMSSVAGEALMTCPAIVDRIPFEPVIVSEFGSTTVTELFEPTTRALTLADARIRIDPDPAGTIAVSFAPGTTPMSQLNGLPNSLPNPPTQVATSGRSAASNAAPAFSPRKSSPDAPVTSVLPSSDTVAPTRSPFAVPAGISWSSGREGHVVPS